MQPPPNTYHSAGVTVLVAAGTLRISDAVDVRLSPVNMKVLLALMEMPQQVVSRNALFEKVWPNQSISDDALTRCIADLRAALGKLKLDLPCIETVPKRGYRWLHPVEQIAALQPERIADNSIKNNDRGAIKGSAKLNTRLVFVALTALFVVVSLVGLFAWIMPASTSNSQRIAVLIFSTSDVKFDTIAVEIRETLIKNLVANKSLSILANFPVRDNNVELNSLRHQYNINKFIEGHIFNRNGVATLSLTVIDARTALAENVIFIKVNEAETKLPFLIDQNYFGQYDRSE